VYQISCETEHFIILRSLIILAKFRVLLHNR